MKDLFSYRLKNSRGLYYVIEDDNLKTVENVTQLRNAPDGWNEKVINWKRNMIDYGVFRSFTIPLKFVLDAAEILRYLFYSESGYESDCILEIMILNNDTYQYDPLFIGEIDFSTFNDSKDFITVNAIEGGFQKLLNNEEDTIYEIPIDDPEAILVRMDGVLLRAQLNFSQIFTMIEAGMKGATILVPIVYLGLEGININIAPAQNVFIQNAPAYSTSDQWFFKAISDTYVNIKGTLNASASYETGDPAGTIEWYVRLSNGYSLLLGTYQVLAGRRVVRANINFDVNFNIPSGVKAFIEMKQNGTQMDFVSASDFSISFGNRKEPKNIKALKSSTVLKRLCEKIGGNLEGAPVFEKDLNVVLTNIDSLLSREDSGVLKIKLSDFFKYSNSVYSATKYINANGNLVFDDLKNAFQDVEILDIGDVSEFEIDVYSEILFNNIRAGYQTQTYEEINGKFEFNATQFWRADVTRIKNELDMICPYRADSIGMEVSRIQLEGKSSTDSKSDNSVFLIHVKNEPSITDEEGNSVYQIERRFSPNSGITETAFNFELSPRNNLVRNGRLLSSLLWKTSKIIHFQSAEKNADLISEWDIPYRRFVEKEDIDLKKEFNYYDQLPDVAAIPIIPIFVPVLIKFEAFVEQDIYSIMKNNPRGYVKFKINGFEFKGYVYEINSEPSIERNKNWTLISHPDNNLKKLSELLSYCQLVSLKSETKEKGLFIGSPYLYEFEVEGTGPIVLDEAFIPPSMVMEFENNKGKIYGSIGSPGIYPISLLFNNCGGQRKINFNIKVFTEIENFSKQNSGEEIGGLKVWDRFVWDSFMLDKMIVTVESQEGDILKKEILNEGINEYTVHDEIPGNIYKISIQRFDGVYTSPKQSLTYTSRNICRTYILDNLNRHNTNYDVYKNCTGEIVTVTVPPLGTVTIQALTLIDIKSSIRRT